ncbi:MAG: DUF4434 domain-containing protein [Candidatus Latescibacteria bacterium]|nr:DUF4434 domain-containing protein [Candidatus Latescibacterota bacterium]
MADPIITGSFYSIQMTNIWNAQYWNDECRDWGETNWRALVADMREVGIDTIINKQMALWTRPLFPDPEMKVGKSVKLGCEDPAMVIADEAARRGMKVWYALGMWGRDSEVADYHALRKPWPDQWFEWNVALAEALMERYADTESFAGFYLPLELSGDPDQGDTAFNEEHIELYTRWIREIRPVIGSTKLLASPGILTPGDYSELSRQLERFDVDIIAYQDYAGRGQSRPEDYERIRRAGEAFELLAPVHRETGVGLWANCETFSRVDPPTWRPVSFTGEIDRIIYQLKVCSEPVDKVITWIYQGVWNKRTDRVNIGPPEAQKLYDDYVAYRRGVLGKPDEIG